MRNYQMTECTYTSYLLAKQGYSLDTIAEIKQRTKETIVGHLIPYIQQSLFSPHGIIVTDEIYLDFLNYIHAHKECNGLKQIYESFNGKIPYDTLRICYYFYHRKRMKIVNDSYISRYFIRNYNVRKDIININKELEAIRGYRFKANDNFFGFIGNYHTKYGYNNYFTQEYRRLDLSTLITPRFLFSMDETTLPSFYMARQGYTLKGISLCRNISEETVVENLLPYVYGGYYLLGTNLIQNRNYSDIQDYLFNNTNCYDCHQKSYQFVDVTKRFDKLILHYEIKLGYYYFFRRLKSPEVIIQKTDNLELLYKDRYQHEYLPQKMDNPLCGNIDYRKRKWSFVTEVNEGDYEYSCNYPGKANYNEDTWDAMTDGMYGEYEGQDDYDFLGY